MNMWYEAMSTLEEVNERGMTTDQKLKLAEVQALLAIGQDLNALRLNDHEPFN